MIEISAEWAGQRLEQFSGAVSAKVCPKSHIYKAIRSGQVRVNKGRVKNEYRLEAGDVLRIPPMRLPDPDA